MTYSFLQIFIVFVSSIVSVVLINWLVYRLFIVKKITQLKATLPNHISQYIQNHQDSLLQIDKISESSFFDEKILPIINDHIDVFINEKLAKEIPMLSMFIGTKTTDKVKQVFVDNVRDLFPVVISNYAKNLLNKEKIDFLIKNNLQPLISQNIEKYQSKLLKNFIYLGVFTGFFISIIHLILLLIIQ